MVKPIVSRCTWTHSTGLGWRSIPPSQVFFRSQLRKSSNMGAVPTGSRVNGTEITGSNVTMTDARPREGPHR
jgi:hypothetical protein